MKKNGMVAKTILSLICLTILVLYGYLMSNNYYANNLEILSIFSIFLLIYGFIKNFIGIELNLGLSFVLTIFILIDYYFYNDILIATITYTIIATVFQIFLYSMKNLLKNHKLHQISKRSLGLMSSSFLTVSTLSLISKIILKISETHLIFSYPTYTISQKLLGAVDRAHPSYMLIQTLFLISIALLHERTFYSKKIDSIKSLSIDITKTILVGILTVLLLLQIEDIFTLSNPFIILAIFILTYLTGKYSGLRLTEVYRFRSLIFKRK